MYKIMFSKNITSLNLNDDDYTILLLYFCKVKELKFKDTEKYNQMITFIKNYIIHDVCDEFIYNYIDNAFSDSSKKILEFADTEDKCNIPKFEKSCRAIFENCISDNFKNNAYKFICQKRNAS